MGVSRFREKRSLRDQDITFWAKNYLWSQGIEKKLLSRIPNVVLTMNSWLAGVVLLGNTGIDMPMDPSIDASATSIIFHTPQDKKHKIVRHVLRFANEPPILSGHAINEYKKDGLKVKAAINTHTTHGSSEGRGDIYVPEDCMGKAISGLEKEYLPGFILLAIEKTTHGKILKAHPELMGKFGSQILIMESLTPLRKATASR